MSNKKRKYNALKPNDIIIEYDKNTFYASKTDSKYHK